MLLAPVDADDGERHPLARELTMTTHAPSIARVAFRRTLPCLTVALLVVACDDLPIPPVARVTGTVVGTVTNALSGAPVTGAVVRIPGAVDTTGVDGQFTLTNATAGAATLRCTAPGFETFETDITVTEGIVSRDISLIRTDTFEIDPSVGHYALYVPATVDTIRGLVVVLGGGDTRWVATNGPSSSVHPTLWALGQWLRSLASTHGLAILGTSLVAMGNEPGSDQILLDAIDAGASRSGHPELGDVPILLYGMSTGGAEASGFAARNPERVAGVFLRAPLGVSSVRSGPALGVPTFVVLAGNDTPADNSAVTATFESNRGAGALWALALEAEATPASFSGIQYSMTTSWITTIVESRLPTNHSGPIREIAETSGWLGDRITGRAEPWASYAGDRSLASWLPSPSVAESWEGLIAARRFETFELGDFALYVPASVPLVRGVILALGGPDTRAFATAKRFGAPNPAVEASLQTLGQEFRMLAAAHGLAIVGTSRLAMPNGSASDTVLMRTLEAFATRSGRPELGYTFLLLYGMSGGGPQASGFAARNPAWVAGLFLKVPAGVSSVSGDALGVPTYMVLAELDAFVNNPALTAAFESNRSAGALWALALERGVPHHSLSPLQRQVTINWINTILEHQLPYEPGWDPLHGFAETSGWLGNRSTGDAAPWVTYTEDRSLASWLPTRETAEDWEGFVAGTPTVITAARRTSTP